MTHLAEYKAMSNEQDKQKLTANSPEAQKIWGSKGGQSLLTKWMNGQKADESDQQTLEQLHSLNRQHSNKK